MQLMFRTRRGVRFLDWSHYALLRDNVQHYLESGPVQRAFRTLHGVEVAIDTGVTYLPTVELRREVQLAWSALEGLPLVASAISLRTHALLTGSVTPPFVRGTFLARDTGWSLPVKGDGCSPLRRFAGQFVEALLDLTTLAAINDRVCVARLSEKSGFVPGFDEPVASDAVRWTGTEDVEGQQRRTRAK